MIGPLGGNFEAFEKIAKLHAKNNFSLAVIAGDIFADPESTSDQHSTALQSLLDGRLSIPLPTYFSIGRYPLPESIISRLTERDGEVCENLFFLGKRATTKTSEGLRIVSLGGLLDPNATAGLSKDKYLPFHTEGDAKSLCGAHRADLLVTFAWPRSIRKGSRIALEESSGDEKAEQCIANLCASLKPRYQLTTSEKFYERERFFHLAEDGAPDPASITRFISVAPSGNSGGQKWLYAFNLDTTTPQASTVPTGWTAPPFSVADKKRTYEDSRNGPNHRFSNDHGGHHRSSKRSRKKGPPPGPGECFFCLSNPNIASQLITSIGDESYLTTAKGPLSQPTTFEPLGFPAHMLIIPLSHSPTIGGISDPESRASTFQEMTRYRRALQKMIATCSNNKFGAVTWELARSEGIHVHWQLIPVASGMIKKGLVEAGFKVEAENEKYPTFSTKTIDEGRGEDTDYFRVWMWQSMDGGESSGEDREKEMVMSLPTDARFDLQFGRRVMAKLLGLESRLQWRDCGQSEDEEKKDAEAFKAAFKDFDFSLQEE